MTAIMYAAGNGHVSTVDLLINAGCDVNLTENVCIYCTINYENNILNEIPELFTDKYAILSILEEDGYLQPTKACYKKFTDMYYDEEYEEKQTKGLEYVKSLIN